MATALIGCKSSPSQSQCVCPESAHHVLQVLAVQARGATLSPGLAEVTRPLPQFCRAAGVAAAEVAAWTALADGHDWGAREDAQGRRDMLEHGCAFPRISMIWHCQRKLNNKFSEAICCFGPHAFRFPIGHFLPKQFFICQSFFDDA